MSRLLYFILFTISINFCFGQSQVDSLSIIVENSNETQKSLDALLQLSNIYFKQDEPDKMFECITKINSTLIDLDYKVSPLFLSVYARFNENISEFEKSIEIYRIAITRSLELDDKQNYIKSSNRLGYLLSVKGDFGEAVDIILKTLSYIDDHKLNDLKESTIVHAAFIYRNSKDFEKAYTYFSMALSIGDSTSSSGYYHVALHELGNLLLTEGDYKKALEYQTRALRLREKLGLTNYLDYSYNDIALSYSFLNNYSKAIEYYNKSIELSKNKKEYWGVAVSYLSIGAMYFDANIIKTSLLYLDSSRVVSEQLGLKENLYQVHKTYYDVYKHVNDYKKALDHYVIAQAYKDSTLGEETQKQIRFLNAKFESEKKDKEIIKNKLVIKRQSLLILTFSIGVLVIAGFLFWLLLLLKRLKNYNIKLSEKNYLIEKQKEEILAQRDELEKQSVILRETNSTLLDRNTKINLQKEEIEAQRDEIESQRDILLSQKQQLTSFNQHLTDSIHYAESIQQSMLPSDWLFNLSFREHFVFYKPLDIVSGDFYWLHREKGLIMFAVADCTGHGVSGAFMSLLGISFLNEIIKIKGIKKPNLVLDELRSNVIDSLRQNLKSGTRKDGMDIALCAFETDSKVLHFSGANNPCWIIKSSGELIGLEPDKNPVSIFFRMESFTSKSIQLDDNDCVYLFTDGIYDQLGGPISKKFQKKKLLEILVEVSKKPMPIQSEILQNYLNQWMGMSTQVDDITVLGVRV